MLSCPCPSAADRGMGAPTALIVKVAGHGAAGVGVGVGAGVGEAPGLGDGVGDVVGDGVGDGVGGGAPPGCGRGEVLGPGAIGCGNGSSLPSGTRVGGGTGSGSVTF